MNPVPIQDENYFILKNTKMQGDFIQDFNCVEALSYLLIFILTVTIFFFIKNMLETGVLTLATKRVKNTSNSMGHLSFLIIIFFKLNVYDYEMHMHPG